MGKLMNIENTRKSICEVLNQSSLPVEVMYYMMKDIMSEVNKLYEESIRNEIITEAAANKEMAEDGEDELSN